MSSVSNQSVQSLREALAASRLEPQDLHALLNRFGPALRRVIRTRLDRQLRIRFDSVDFVQMLWMTVCRHPDLLSNRDDDSILKVLVGVAKNKVREARRAESAQCRDVARTRELCPSDAATFDTPSQVMEAQELFDELIATAQPMHKDILILRSKGATFREISSKLRINERTARRAVDLARARVQRQQKPPPDGDVT